MTHHTGRCEQIIIVVNPFHHFQRIFLSLLSTVVYKLFDTTTKLQTRLPANVICLNSSTEEMCEDGLIIVLEN